MAADPDAALVIDAIVALVALEAALLVAARTWFGRGPPWASSVANCAAGGALLLALRAVIDAAPFAVVGLCLFAALVAHVADLTLRWTGPRRAGAARPLPPSSALASESSRV